jgi:hypothetical protein
MKFCQPVRQILAISRRRMLEKERTDWIIRVQD